MRISTLLIPTTWLVGQLICLQAASAQSVTVTEEKLETKQSRLTPSLTTSYVRSAAGQDSAYYQSLANAELNVSYGLANAGSLNLSTGISRDLDALEERNVWSSTSLTYASPNFAITDDLGFRYTGSVVAPTNSESRDYLSYRGSLSGAGGLVRNWRGLPVVRNLSAGLSGSATRNFFEYDATRAGRPNTVVALGSAVSAAVELSEAIRVSGQYGFKKAQKTNGTWADYRYEHTLAAAVNLNKNLSVSVSESTENRAYSYDAQTIQFALYDFQTTVYELAATYTF